MTYLLSEAQPLYLSKSQVFVILAKFITLNVIINNRIHLINEADS